MGVVMGLDIGGRRIGVAVSDELGILASPLKTVERVRDRDAIAEIGRLATAHRVERIVVGLPKTLRNEIGPQANKVIGFTEKLRMGVTPPIEFLDERFTTAEAARVLRPNEPPRSRRKTSKKRQRYVRENIDQVAAVLLLEAYLAGTRQRRSRDDAEA